MKTTNEQPTAPGKPDPNKADLCLLVYFKDNKARSFYNYHTAYNAESKRITVDHKVALNKLIRLLQYKFAGKYKTAICYYKPDKQESWQQCRDNRSAVQLFKYVNDKMIQTANYSFRVDHWNTYIKL